MIGTMSSHPCTGQAIIMKMLRNFFHISFCVAFFSQDPYICILKHIGIFFTPERNVFSPELGSQVGCLLAVMMKQNPAGGGRWKGE